MDLSTFFQKFDQFADAPDAISAMRELVLQFAVRGSLTERIAGESSKAQLALADTFRVKRAKREEPDTEDIPFPIPENWGWVAVGDSMDMFNGRAFKPAEWSSEGTPIIRIQNLNNEQAAFNRCKADLDPKIHVNDGDFLISWSGTPGTSFGAFIWNRGFAYLNQHIFRCELVKGVFVKEFLRLAINARLDEMISHAQGAVGLRHITKGKLESIRLPLPPLAEQKRIVAKVDELMALCDRLEAQQQERETRHAALARASLSRFAEAPTPANLEWIFHPSYPIPPADLRKAILTLAVQGKLVAQDPNDEPAEVLLAKLMMRDAQETGRRKKSQPDLAFTPEEIPFELPSGWSWERLGNIGETNIGLTYSPQDVSDVGIPVLRSSNVQNGKLDFADLVRVKCEPKQSVMVQDGDLLICARNGSRALVGKVAVIEDLKEPAAFGAFMAIYRSEVNQYLYHFIRSPLFRQMIDEVNTTTINQITQNNLRSTLAPIPPLAEQRRIVAKVDQLMALVDALETQLAASRATAANLLSALVAELTGTPNNVKASIPSASTTGRRGRPRKS